MALDREIARLSKILMEGEGLGLEEAQARLRSMTLEVVVGTGAACPAGHAAVLTALSVGRRTFVGGVRITGAAAVPLLTTLPVAGRSLSEACGHFASDFEGPPSRRIVIGSETGAETPGEGVATVSCWWDGWRAGVGEPKPGPGEDGSNPLAGIAAAALAVGTAFEHSRNGQASVPADIDLWGGDKAPDFAEMFLPQKLWLIGLGNLGQAFLWALSALPYQRAADVSLVLQDFDSVNPENWGTSVLVRQEAYGALKNKVAEQWAERRGFQVRRIDRRMRASDRREADEPALAFSGVDKVAVRRDMADVGFGAIIDAGLGRTAHDYDKYRVDLFDRSRPIDLHFAEMSDPEVGVPADPSLDPALQALEEALGACGAAEFAGASVAAPHVSAIAGAVAVARAIALASNCPCAPSEVRRVAASEPRRRPGPRRFDMLAIPHAGRPVAISGLEMRKA